jgi:hypothetical protein
MLDKLLSLLASALKFNKIAHKGICIAEQQQEIILLFDKTPPSVLTAVLEKNNIPFDVENDTLFIYFN